MKSWALVLILVAAFLVPSQKAMAKETTAKRKVVVISFTESDLKQNRAPASIDDQKEMDAEARHQARLAEANDTVPEM